MSDGRLGGSQVDKADTAALRRFLLDLDGDRKAPGLATGNASGRDVKDAGRDASSKGTGKAFSDSFLRFDDPFANSGERSKTAVQVEQVQGLVRQRTAAENSLSTEQKDDLRRARRDYSLAKTADEKSAYARQIEGLVPGSGDLNTKIRTNLVAMRSDMADLSRFERMTPRFTSTIQCHSPRQEPSYYEQKEQKRLRQEYDLKQQVRDAADRFYQPRKEDEFEARWAKMALESPMVKATEALKQLPPVRISAENTNEVVKFGMTIAGVEMDAQSREMMLRAIGGVKSIAKEGANRFVIDRDMKTEILLPEKRDVAAGIRISGIEVDSLRFQLGDGKYPELKNIEGLKVKLDVPLYLNKGVQIDNEAQIKRIFMTRNEGTGDLTVNAVVTNPVPTVVRHSLHFFNSEVPVADTIVAPIAVLGPDGKPR